MSHHGEHAHPTHHPLLFSEAHVNPEEESSLSSRDPSFSNLPPLLPSASPSSTHLSFLATERGPSAASSSHVGSGEDNCAGAGGGGGGGEGGSYGYAAVFSQSSPSSVAPVALAFPPTATDTTPSIFLEGGAIGSSSTDVEDDRPGLPHEREEQRQEQPESANDVGKDAACEGSGSSGAGGVAAPAAAAGAEAQSSSTHSPHARPAAKAKEHHHVARLAVGHEHGSSGAESPGRVSPSCVLADVVTPETFPGDDEGKAGTLVMEFFVDKPSAYLSMTRAEMSAHIARTLESGQALRLGRRNNHRHDHPSHSHEQTARSHVHKQDRKEFVLHSRDLRKLDISVTEDTEPFIIVRRHVILLKIVPVRAIILHDRCLLLLPQGADAYLGRIRLRLEPHVDSHGEDAGKFELRALEAILDATLTTMKSTLGKLSPKAVQAMRSIKTITTRALEEMRRVKNEIDDFLSSLLAVIKVLKDLLDNEEDLFLMSLTRLWEEPHLWDLPRVERQAIVDEVEILIESYVMSMNQIHREVVLLQQRIKNTESLMDLRLDTARNSLLSLGVVFALLSACISAGTLVPGFFGMNLLSNVEDVDGVFRTVIIVTVVCVVVVFLLVLSLLYWRRLLIF